MTIDTQELRPSSELEYAAEESTSRVWLWDALGQHWHHLHEGAAFCWYRRQPTMYPVFMRAECIPLPEQAIESLPPADDEELDAVLLIEERQFSKAYGLLIAERDAQAREIEVLRKDAAIGAAIHRACTVLPEGCSIEIYLEKDSGSVYLETPQSYGAEYIEHDGPFGECVGVAINAALTKTGGVE